MSKKSKLVSLRGIVEDSNIIEQFEKLQVNLSLSSVDKKAQVIQVTSSLQDEGKTTIAINLANSYAMKGSSVLVIDLDIRRPKIHRNFNQVNDNGIVDYAAGTVEKEHLIKKTTYGIDVINTGKKSPYPVKILESALIKDLIEDMRAKYDYIILDSPPVSPVIDPIIISKLTDAVVFVVQANRTKKSDIKESIKQLENAKANIAGIVLTNVKAKYSKYSYKYKYEENGN
ncbi:MAG: CpsD/CapB family tyrosine-protein kinase [Bacilli bacterium]